MSVSKGWAKRKELGRKAKGESGRKVGKTPKKG